MSKCADLLAKAQRNPQGLRFRELTQLAECWDFEERRSRAGGSHRIYKRPGVLGLMNFQPDQNGMAKRPQVLQLLNAIEALAQSEEEP